MIRDSDIPLSLYPGMWLQEPSGVPFSHPTVEVVRVGRTHVKLFRVGKTQEEKWAIPDAQQTFRKVYASNAEAAPWIQPGCNFDVPGWGRRFNIRTVRWAFASARCTTSGLFLFFKQATLEVVGHPETTLWTRLMSKDPLS